MGIIRKTLLGLALLGSCLAAQPYNSVSSINPLNSMKIKFFSFEKSLPKKIFYLASAYDSFGKTLNLSICPIDVFPGIISLNFCNVDINKNGLNLKIHTWEDSAYASCTRSNYDGTNSSTDRLQKHIFDYLFLAENEIRNISSRNQLENLVKSEEIFRNPEGVDVYFPANNRTNRKARAYYHNDSCPNIIIKFDLYPGERPLPFIKFFYTSILENQKEKALIYSGCDIGFSQARVETKPIEPSE